MCVCAVVQDSLFLNANIDELRHLRAFVEGFCEAQSLDLHVANQLLLVLEEIFTNAVDYGYQPSNRADGEIRVSLAVGAPGLTVTFEDNGAAYNPFEEAPQPDVDGTVEDREVGGLGVFLIRELMDDVGYSRRDVWNHYELVKHLPPRDGADS